MVRQTRVKIPQKKIKARVVMTPGSHKAPGKGRPRRPMVKTPERGKYKASYTNDQILHAIL
jgi:hypothetical protein